MAAIGSLRPGTALWRVGQRSFLVEHLVSSAERWIVDTEPRAEGEQLWNAEAMLIETRRLILRPLVIEEDLDRLFVLNNDPDVMEFLNGGKPVSREDVDRDYRRRLARGRYYMAFETHTCEFVGWFAFDQKPGCEPGSYSLGYRLCRAAWGRGYATEGARALINLGFRKLGVQRVSADTMAVNTRSRRVMEKAGLSYVRTYHLEWDDPLPGTELGEVEYALARDEWERTGKLGW